MHTPKRVLVAAALAAVAALTFTGCSAASSPETTAAGDASVSPPTILSAGKLTICTSNNGAPPNIFSDETGALIGSEVDLAKAVAGELGLEPEFVTVDFSALIPSLQAKQCDVIMASLYIKPEREEIVDFVPYLTSATGVAVKAGSDSGISGLNDTLCGKKVMVSVGTTAQSLTEEQSTACTDAGEPAIDISTNSQTTVGLQQLVSGQLDAYVDASELIGYYQKQGTAGIELTGEPTDSITIGAATLKDDPALHDAIQKAFDELTASGEYASILDTWGQSSLAYTATS